MDCKLFSHWYRYAIFFTEVQVANDSRLFSFFSILLRPILQPFHPLLSHLLGSNDGSVNASDTIAGGRPRKKRSHLPVSTN